MSETITEKATCEKCGADVREGTAFCYNCGINVVESSAAESGESDTAQSDAVVSPTEGEPVESVKPDGAADKLARAAEQRRKARVGLRRTTEYTWERVDDFRLVALAALVIGAIAFGVVFLTVFWK